MGSQSRRGFLRQSSLIVGLAGAGSVVLADEVGPTESSGELGDFQNLLAASGQPLPEPAGKWAATEDNILGPFHRSGAPYRAKITPPLAPGKPLLVRGHVWGVDTRKPLVGAMLDIWQANHLGRYDNDDPENPPQPGIYKYRARVVTDENGYYEYETIHPGAYKIGPNSWRPSHIHYLVRARGYKKLVTQLYFSGDKHNETDRFIKKSLIIDVEQLKTPQGSYGLGTFDIVLAKA